MFSVVKGWLIQFEDRSESGRVVVVCSFGGRRLEYRVVRGKVLAPLDTTNNDPLIQSVGRDSNHSNISPKTPV
jgi:hypothetical protein